MTSKFRLPKFPENLINNPDRKGELAADKQFIGKDYRYAVAPVHTRFNSIVWFVWDADIHDPIYDRDLIMGGGPAVIRQANTLEAALAGLV